jgi:hypothetical protein
MPLAFLSVNSRATANSEEKRSEVHGDCAGQTQLVGGEWMEFVEGYAVGT